MTKRTQMQFHKPCSCLEFYLYSNSMRSHAFSVVYNVINIEQILPDKKGRQVSQTLLINEIIKIINKINYLKKLFLKNFKTN